MDTRNDTGILGFPLETIDPHVAHSADISYHIPVLYSMYQHTSLPTTNSCMKPPVIDVIASSVKSISME